MCRLSKVIICLAVLWFGAIGVITSFPTTTSLLANNDTESAPAPRNDTVTAKYGNSTIIFGHQHVLFAAPTRASSRHRVNDSSAVENLVASSSSRRQSKGPLENEEGLVRIDYTSSEERDLFNFSDEVQEDEEKRQALCPGAGRHRQQTLYDQSTGKCGKAGDRAHCGANMVFRYDPFVDNSSVYGYCECDFSQKTPLVYHAETKSCYFIYQKAYCDPKEWLIFNDQRQPICTKRTCPKSSSRRSKLLTELVEVPLNGTGPCVALDQPSKHCGDSEETVHFLANEIVPRCGIERIAPAPRIISPIRQVRCRPGSYVNIVGKCQPSWEW